MSLQGEPSCFAHSAQALDGDDDGERADEMRRANSTQRAAREARRKPVDGGDGGGDNEGSGNGGGRNHGESEWMAGKGAATSDDALAPAWVRKRGPATLEVLPSRGGTAWSSSSMSTPSLWWWWWQSSASCAARHHLFLHLPQRVRQWAWRFAPQPCAGAPPDAALPTATTVQSRRPRIGVRLVLRRALQLFVALYALALFVPADAWTRYVAGPRSIQHFSPDIFAHCAPPPAATMAAADEGADGGGGAGAQARRDGKGLAVVMPLVASQVGRAVDHIRLWSATPELAPCRRHDGSDATAARHGNASSSPAAIDLIFYFDRPLEHVAVAAAVAKLRAALQRAPEQPRRCFRAFKFMSAEMSAEQSRNTYHHHWATLQPKTRGTVTQFYRLMLSSPDVERAYTHVFYMEPDARPIRAHWLDALHRLAHADATGFWMMGSMMRYPKPIVLGLEPYRSHYLHHINGNAIYRVGCPCFKAYLREVWREYGDYAFDTSIAFHRLDLRNYALLQRIAHRFVHTNVVADLGTFDYSAWKAGNDGDKAHENAALAGTYIAHGKSMYSRFDWRKLGSY